jgi:hypothetical protein
VGKHGFDNDFFCFSFWLGDWEFYQCGCLSFEPRQESSEGPFFLPEMQAPVGLARQYSPAFFSFFKGEMPVLSAAN